MRQRLRSKSLLQIPYLFSLDVNAYLCVKNSSIIFYTFNTGHADFTEWFSICTTVHMYCLYGNHLGKNCQLDGVV